MEFFGARHTRAIDTCLEEVRRSDIIVVVVGHRYGTIVPELGISYSEAEYRSAFEQNKPCLVYMRDENVPILPKFVERDPERARLLEDWTRWLNERHTVPRFRDASTLAVQVAADLGRTLRSFESVEQTRAEQNPKIDLNSEISALVNNAQGSGLTKSEIISVIRQSLTTSLALKQDLAPTLSLLYAKYDTWIMQEVARGLKEQGIRLAINEIMFAPNDESLLKYGVKAITLRVNDANFSGANASVRAIEEVIDTTKIAVVFISEHSAENAQLEQAISMIVHKRLTMHQLEVLPIILDDTPIPPLLRDAHPIDLRNRKIAEGISQLAEVIRRQGPLRLSQDRPVPAKRLTRRSI